MYRHIALKTTNIFIWFTLLDYKCTSFSLFKSSKFFTKLHREREDLTGYRHWSYSTVYNIAFYLSWNWSLSEEHLKKQSFLNQYFLIRLCMIYAISYNQRHEDIKINIEHDHLHNKSRQLKLTMLRTNGNVDLYL